MPQTYIYAYLLASSVVDSYPAEPQKYKCLKTVLKRMRNGSFNVHPFTVEMLSSLDKYVKPTTYSNNLHFYFMYHIIVGLEKSFPYQTSIICSHKPYARDYRSFG